MEAANEYLTVIDITKSILNSLGKLKEYTPREKWIQSGITGAKEVLASLVLRREEQLRNLERVSSPYEYMADWCFFPNDRIHNIGHVLRIDKWFEYEIDAVTDACKELKVVHSKVGFWVLLLRTRGSFPAEVSYQIKHAMSPWTKDGSIPLYMGDSGKKFATSMLDEIYAERSEALSWDEWDGPSGVKFIIVVEN